MAKKNKKQKERIKQRRKERLFGEKPEKRVIRHNTAANQEKHRLDWQPLQPDEEGVIADRRIMPLDEADRREGLLLTPKLEFQADFADAMWQTLADRSPFDLGVVVEVGRGLCRAAVHGEVIVCDIRGTLIAEETGFTNVVAVGDRVLVRPHSEARGLVEEVLPRRSGLARADVYQTHLRQMIAANVDQLLIVAAWLEPQIWFQMIDEYLIGAARNDLQAVIVINKVDLAGSWTEVTAAVQPYRQLGHQVILTSTVTGEGVNEVAAVLRGQTTVLAGLSGVGKSSLLNAIQPGLKLRTGEVSQLKSREGRHTTTKVNMLPLAMGGYVIDTPGIKDMGLAGLHPDDLILYYPDIEAVWGQCRFTDCTHEHEPGCAVRQAVESGRIAEWRYYNYTNLYTRLVEGET
jgi:ribosome biogenesis GTPase